MFLFRSFHRVPLSFRISCSTFNRLKASHYAVQSAPQYAVFQLVPIRAAPWLLLLLMGVDSQCLSPIHGLCRFVAQASHFRHFHAYLITAKQLSNECPEPPSFPRL
jgi:hypothetical protein